MRPKRWALFFILLCIVSCSSTVGRKGALKPVPEVRPGEVESAYAPRRIALLIGINNFKDKNWRPLKYAEKDAVEFGAILADKAGGAFDEVLVLARPEDTTASNILKAFDKIAALNTNPQDTVVVYFSTHGTLEKNNSGSIDQYLVAYDTILNDIAGTGLNMEYIRKKFATLKSNRKVIIFATCHSGQGKSELNPTMNEELRHTKAGFFVKPLETVSEASFILSACAWGETAREDERLGHDIYTNFFIEALKKYDPNQNGATTVSEAHDYARERTYYFTNGSQRPTAVSDIWGNDPIILTGKISRPGKPAIFSYNDSMRGVEVHINGSPKGSLPGSVVVEEGTQELKLIRADSGMILFDGRIEFSEGERIDADKLANSSQNFQSIDAGYSYRAFFNSDVNESLFSPIQMYGVQYSRSGPWTYTCWGFRVFAGQTSENLMIDDVYYDTQLTRLDTEADFLFRYPWSKFAVTAGPVIGLVYLKREFSDRPDNESDDYTTGTFGILSGFEISPYKNFSIGTEAGIYSVPLYVDEDLYFEAAYSATLFLKYRM